MRSTARPPSPRGVASAAIVSRRDVVGFTVRCGEFLPGGPETSTRLDFRHPPLQKEPGLFVAAAVEIVNELRVGVRRQPAAQVVECRQVGTHIQGRTSRRTRMHGGVQRLQCLKKSGFNRVLIHGLRMAYSGAQTRSTDGSATAAEAEMGS